MRILESYKIKNLDIVDTTMGEVVVSYAQLKKDFSSFLSSMTEKIIFNLCDIEPLSRFENRGPAFITQGGDFLYMDDLGWDVHRGLSEEIIQEYLCNQYPEIDSFNDELLYKLGDALKAEFGGATHLLDTITRQLQWTRVNSGSKETDERFYLVFFNAPTKLQQIALEEVFDWGIDNRVGLGMILRVYPNGITQSRNVTLLPKDDGKTIVKKINNWFATGYFVEALKKINKNKHLIENWVDQDTGKEYYDYKTGTIKNPPYDVIDTSKTGMSFYDSLTPGNPDNNYMAKEKNLYGKIVQMSPNEYYKECATNIFKKDISYMKNLKQSRAVDSERVDTIKTVIGKFKKQLPVPFIDYACVGQEGLHRMMVLGELFGWDQKFPVLIVNWVNADLQEQREKQERIRDIQHCLKDVCLKATGYEYNSLDEFKDELQYQVNKGFEYFDEFDNVNGDIPFEFREEDGLYIIEVLDVPFMFDKDDVKINAIQDVKTNTYNLDALDDDILLDDNFLKGFKG